MHVRTGNGLPRSPSALGLDGAGLTPATPAPILGGFQKLIAAPSLAVMLICPIEYRRRVYPRSLSSKRARPAGACGCVAAQEMGLEATRQSGWERMRNRRRKGVAIGARALAHRIERALCCVTLNGREGPLPARRLLRVAHGALSIVARCTGSPPTMRASTCSSR